MITVAGIAVGVVVVGLGSRLAMLLIRMTSPSRVIGMQSDDGFKIGEVTLAGTYNLVILGAFVGVLGVGAYRLVRPWLIGPLWFRRLTTGFGAGVVVGAMLIHTDGIDFRVLKPTWLAIALFIALPAVFGVAIAAAVDAVERPDSWTARGHWRWILPLVAVAVAPPVVVFLGFALVFVGVWALTRGVNFSAEAARVKWLPQVVRAGFIVIVAASLVALYNDIVALV